MAEYKASQLSGLRERLENMKEVPIKKADILSFIDGLFNSPNLLDRTLGVFLATGRRSEEVLFRADKKDLGKLYMKGIAKKSNPNEETHFSILDDQKKVLEVIKEIREDKLNYHYVRKHLLDNYKDQFRGMNDLRKLYGVYSYALLSKEEVHLN
jgi:hypothetical protein